MTDDRLTQELAHRVLGWKSAPGRFLMTGRRWTPSWRFQPLARLEDAFKVLEAAKPQEYAMGATGSGEFWVKVRIAGRTGEARGKCKARVVAVALARTIGVNVA